MDLETAQITTTAKFPTLKHENGNSFEPIAKTTTNVDGTSTTLIPGPITTKEKYKDAKTLFAAIQTRFGGNEATKKTQKTLLKQIQLAILGETISQEDLNLKFLRSIPSEWNTHVVVWRNKPDLDTMSFDDLYNNFKIIEQEVKGTASSSSSSNSQNMAFVSSPSSTNEVNTAYGVSTANTQVSPASTQVSTASTQVSTANLSDDTVYAFLASQPNGSQLVYEDLEQIHEDDIEEMDLKWQLALLSMRTRRGPRNQDSRNMNQDSSRRTVNVEETSSKAMLAIDGAGFDWSYMADDEVPTNMALMDFSDSERFNAVPTPPIGLFSPPNLDLSNSGLEEFQQPEFESYGPKTSKNVSEDTSNEVRESPDAPMVKKLVLVWSPPIRKKISSRKYKNSIAIATGCKRFKNTKRSNRKIRIPIALWPCKVEEEMTLEEVDGQMVGKVETKIIAKDGTITKVPGKFKSYETSDEETEEQPRRRDLYRFVDHPQIQQANLMNEFAPHQIPQPLGNMNGWLIESEEEAERDEVDSDLESTASSKPVGEKNDKDDHGYASHPCPWCSK
ncbi:hypothetical protein Tco_1569641 [Tanacetum coccineum]